MSIRFLRSIEHTLFPLTITSPEEIAEAEELSIGGLITLGKASGSREARDVCYQETVILDITYLGRAELRRQQTGAPWDWRKPKVPGR